MSEAFGPYQLLERIAAGGMGELYLARLRREGGFEKILVIKRILPWFSSDPRFVEMFTNEARLAAALDHRNIVAVYDFGSINGSLFIAMEYVHGRDLREALLQARNQNVRFTPALAARVIINCCKALEYAHNPNRTGPVRDPVIHRDISPHNILIGFSGEVKVTDFGLARPLSGEESESGMLKGKYSYMSPEQISMRHLDHRTDLYSLGVVFFEMLGGQQLFPLASGLVDMAEAICAGRQNAVDEALHDIGDPLREVVRRAIAPGPEDRYQSAGEFRAAVESACDNLGITGSTISLAQWMASLFPGASRPVLPGGDGTQVAAKPILSAPEQPAAETSLTPDTLPPGLAPPPLPAGVTPPDGMPAGLRISTSLPAAPGETQPRWRWVASMVVFSVIMVAVVFGLRYWQEEMNESRPGAEGAVISHGAVATRPAPAAPGERPVTPAGALAPPIPAATAIKPAARKPVLNPSLVGRMAEPPASAGAGVRPSDLAAALASAPVESPPASPLPLDAPMIRIEAQGAYSLAIPGKAESRAGQPQLLPSVEGKQKFSLTRRHGGDSLGPLVADFRMEIRPGMEQCLRITMSTNPWSTIFVNGDQTGQSPLTNLELGGGDHIIGVQIQGAGVIEKVLRFNAPCARLR
ncbi:MAG: Serine/threonine-protein kinase PknD [Myxococcota bacterium]|nr:Serine/threonine-protein kinase PknD [Myxococcota bacterium]